MTFLTILALAFACTSLLVALVALAVAQSAYEQARWARGRINEHTVADNERHDYIEHRLDDPNWEVN